MSHFSKKYIKGIIGAGSSRSSSPSLPSPPTLKPPKLGDLQALSSYDYSESIDLISDGEIDGLVNSHGRYVDNIGLFESIYLEDIVVRQPIDEGSSETVSEYDLSFIQTAIENKFYSNGSFVDTLVSSVSNFTGNNGSGISFSFLGSKNTIAESIFQTVSDLNNSYNIGTSNSSNAIFKQLRILKSQFNFLSKQEVQTYLLEDFPDKLAEEYPFVSLKVSFNIPLDVSYSYSIDDIFQFNNDIYNQIYLPLEQTELQNKKNIASKKAISLVYFTYENETYSLKGDFYLFLYQNDGYLLQNGIDAIINHVENVKILKTFSKFNYANASFEVRNGSDLQKPLSLFNKTYLDTFYNNKLKGPFQKNLPVLTLLNLEYNQLETRYDQNNLSSRSGKLSDSNIAIGNSFVSKSEYDSYKVLHTFLFRNDEQFNKDVYSMNNGGGSPGRSDVFKNINISGDIISAEFLSITPTYGYKNWQKISFNKRTKTFDKNSTFWTEGASGVGQLPFLNNGVIYITSASDFDTYYYGVRSASEYSLLCRVLLDKAFGNVGSDDFRKISATQATSFSDWNKDYTKYASEPAPKIVHTVLNPNVDRVFLTLNINYLMDTAQQTISLLKADGTIDSVEAGANVPSVIEFIIESGYQNPSGLEEIFLQRTYQIKGLVNSPVFLDIGREENAEFIQQYSRFILGTENIAQPISLPPYVSDKTRFVRIYRTTHESYSSLIRREIYLQKITEIINAPFSYPHSAICGLKLDARSLSSIPARSYDARFKKVFVPSNYFPLKANGQDKRYILRNNLASFNSLSSSSHDKIIYKGNWDGTFKLAWTDNPVWVLFDILINRRYGLGNFISPSEVNYWELYKIGRYCDAVDSNGVFAGVSAADGGLEPRYAFNGVIADKTNVFESLKSLVACFRGNMFYTNSEINFTNDRLKPVMAFFNNSNVKDGMFNYSNERRDLQYNVIEVTYLDRDDLFKQKIEYVEDPDDIKTRGILRTTAQTFGITSRSHAKRLGEHIIYSTINEDENVAFVAGLESLLCRPGDLISINDEVKTLKRHVGRVLDVDPITNSIYTNISLKSSDFSSSGLTGEISVLIPTGKLQSSDFYDLSKSPTKLNISQIYQTDVPVRVTFQTTGRKLLDSARPVDYGSTFYIDTNCSGYPLFQEVRAGTPCSITLSNSKQQTYKIQSIKELNLNEYEVIASKFDTGKFSEIEKGETGLLQDFFSAFPPGRNTSISEGNGKLLENQYKYNLSYPAVLTFSTGNLDFQNDTADLSGTWVNVPNANSYNVELITPKYKSIKQTVTGASVIFKDQAEVGRYTLKVTARNTGSYPNPISATASRTTTILSYTAPVRNNGIIQGFVINR
jgi:hypothetical protein